MESAHLGMQLKNISCHENGMLLYFIDGHLDCLGVLLDSTPPFQINENFKLLHSIPLHVLKIMRDIMWMR